MKINKWLFLPILFNLALTIPSLAQSLPDPVSNYRMLFGNPVSFVDQIQQRTQAPLAQVLGAFVAVVGFNLVISAFIKK
jgi:hypothetical protein